MFGAVFNTIHYLRRAAHERPVIFFALIVGAFGPVAVLTVPGLRAQQGWKPAERVPISYPLPDRQRSPVSGYDDE
ncbi:hypothetical protein Malapachy_1485 [Malassezia pachydermatis]|uniref:Nadh-ubiquinone oxidoreductase kDa subunit n=1 Tax=Malassezia pachydermatis TaxID=77020 RepID=A0A0M8MT46_9BASI|nr:hypothetical protein Malapachy_1485 [Malassezia pachydermatis]KOS13250.1 hypothetical protein Malapachy_1485 [Malassezia pachydermatis]